MVTHANVLHHLAVMGECYGIDEDDRFSQTRLGRLVPGSFSLRYSLFCGERLPDRVAGGGLRVRRRETLLPDRGHHRLHALPLGSR